MLPKQLHVIWIGDESRRPDNCIATWIEHNPTWSVRVWGNQDLAEYGWINSHHMREMAPRELNGVADMMRWEILYHEGGFLVDADSVCVRPLDDWLLELEAFACWENELVRPGLIAAGYVAASAGNPFIGQIIKDIQAEPSVVHEMAWKTVGPQRLTDAHKRYQYSGLSILPSHFFIPEHFSGARYEGSGPIYAQQHWGSTRRSYDTLHQQAVGTPAAAAMPAPNPEPAPAPEPLPTPPAMPPITSTASAPSDMTAPPAPRRSVLEDQHAPYFVQKVTVSRELVGRNRIDVFRDICKGRRVLHAGCTDWPISDPATSLHVQLDSACAQLDGFDIPTEAFAVLQPHVRRSPSPTTSCWCPRCSSTCPTSSSSCSSSMRCRPRT
jgi:mannosyltransferase OCH1-like enzyme